MSIIYLAKGTATMGMTKVDQNGNVVSQTHACFNFDDDGGCVAVGELDSETMRPNGTIAGVFGDWDATGYLAMALSMLQPTRRVNIPDLASIVQTAAKDGVDICDYCQALNCAECVVMEWKEAT